MRLRSWNLALAVALLAANGLAWMHLASSEELVQVEARLDPQIVAIRESLWSGEAVGESFAIVITDQMASEAVAWFLENHPEVPFSHPLVAVDPQGITGSGLAHVLGIRASLFGRVGMTLENGVPMVTIDELGVAGIATPEFLLDIIQSELEAQLDLSDGRLPMEITRLELGPGTITVEGIYR